MHAPSALVAGAVLTFGAAALANLYLPAGAQAPLTAAAAPIAPIAIPAPTTAATEPAPTPDLDASSFALTMQDATQQALQPFISTQTEQLASSQDGPAPTTEPATAAPAEPIAAEPAQEPPKPARKPAAPTPKKKPASKPAPERTQSRAEADEPPAAFAPTQAAAPAIFGEAPAPARRSEAASVSAISAGRAWVRLGDSRTVAVQAGDVLPTFGRIKAVSTDAVTFENGTVLRIQP